MSFDKMFDLTAGVYLYFHDDTYGLDTPRRFGDYNDDGKKT